MFFRDILSLIGETYADNSRRNRKQKLGIKKINAAQKIKCGFCRLSMPTSKHRKKKGLKKRKFIDLSETRPQTTRIRIRRHRFRELRNNQDFLALIKVGRAVNAVTSGLQFISDYMDDNTPVGRRQYYRAVFMTSGFLYEGLELVTSLRLKYLNEPFFTKLNVLIGDKYKRHRKILQEIRNSIAFHLDSDDKSTKLALSNLNLSRYDLMSGSSDKVVDFYFDMADTIDWNYLIDKFKDGRPEPEVNKELLKLVSEVMTNFSTAGHEFLTGLGEKMKFSEYVD